MTETEGDRAQAAASRLRWTERHPRVRKSKFSEEAASPRASAGGMGPIGQGPAMGATFVLQRDPSRSSFDLSEVSLMRASRMAVVLAGAMSLAAAPSFAKIAIPDVQRASGYCKSAERAMRAGNLKKAQASLDKAIEVMPNFPGAHMGLGHMALMERRFEDALREYQEARDDYALFQGAMLNLH